MTVNEMALRLDGSVVAASEAATADVRGGYASDLMSDVMARGREGDVWITLQKHVNIVAVAQLKGLAAVVIVNGRHPDDETLARAEEHRIPLVITPLPAFDAAGRLFELGIRGSRTP